MARPKKHKTIYIQTNPKIDELNKIGFTFPKQRTDITEFHSKVDKWLKDNEEAYEKMSEEQKQNFALKIDDNGFVVPCELPMDVDLEFCPTYKETQATEVSNLTAQQLANLLPILNDNCFVEAMTVNELKEVFEGKRTAKVKNIGVLAYILKKLAIRGLICDDWQHQAESLKMFVSVRNTPIKGNKMASYLSTIEEQIKAYNGEIYKDNIPPPYKAKKELKQEIDNIVDSL